MELLPRLDSLRARAERYLREKEPETSSAQIEPYAIDVMADEDQHVFTFEFLAMPDDETVWRVGIENGEPVWTTFDH